MTAQRVFLSPPHMGGDEQFFVGEAFKSNYIAPLGPQVDAFEKEFCEHTGTKHAAALTSGTAAIHIAFRLLGVEPGDEVFASTLTFVGGVTPVTFQGAAPVFIDCDKHSWNMDPDLLEKELARCANNGKLPKAVIPTDLYGQCVNMERILDICDGYGVPVICDSAEALGAKYLAKRHGDAKGIKGAEYVHAGVGAKAAVYSFNGNKIITTSGGGMLVSDDKTFIEKARFLSQQARDPFVHYEHSEIGFNYRMSNIAAAIGRGQLRVLEERVARKREIFDYYKDALGDLDGIEFMPEADYGRCTRWLTVVLITPELFGSDREAIRLALEKENIESRPVFKPMHLQPVFDRSLKEPKAFNGKKRYPCRVVGGAVAEDLFERGLCLPSGTAMTEADLNRVASVIKGLSRCANNGKLPKAVIPTGLYDQRVDMERMIDICDGYGEPVICDSAEALGVKYLAKRRGDAKDKKRAGSVHAGVGAKAAVYSFNGNKIITTSGGGVLVSDDKAFIEKAGFLSQQPRDPFAHHEHFEIGFNYRMSNIAAANGRRRLRVLEERVARKREIFDYYIDALGDLDGIEFMPEADDGRCIRWLTVVLITPELFGSDREAIRLALEKENIVSPTVIKPMHLQPLLDRSLKEPKALNGKKRYPCRVIGRTFAEALYKRGLYLPSGTAMTEADLNRVAKVIKGMYRS